MIVKGEHREMVQFVLGQKSEVGAVVTSIVLLRSDWVSRGQQEFFLTLVSYFSTIPSLSGITGVQAVLVA
jgi:hypothetical protein